MKPIPITWFSFHYYSTISVDLRMNVSRYKGGVILVSHDERLLKMVCQELWVCSKGKVFWHLFDFLHSNDLITYLL